MNVTTESSRFISFPKLDMILSASQESIFTFKGVLHHHLSLSVLLINSASFSSTASAINELLLRCVHSNIM